MVDIMFKFLIAIFSLRILFKFIAFVIAIFLVYGFYLFINGEADLADLKDYMANAFNNALKWLEKLFTNEKLQEKLEDRKPMEAFLNIKDSTEFLVYYIKNSLC